MADVGRSFRAVTVGQNMGLSDDGEWPCALRVGTGGGDLTLVAPNGDSAVFKNIVNGEWIDCAFKQVSAVTGTVADIVAFYF